MLHCTVCDPDCNATVYADHGVYGKAQCVNKSHPADCIACMKFYNVCVLTLSAQILQMLHVHDCCLQNFVTILASITAPALSASPQHEAEPSFAASHMPDLHTQYSISAVGDL